MRSALIAMLFATGGCPASGGMLVGNRVGALQTDGSTTYRLKILPEEGETFRGIDVELGSLADASFPYTLGRPAGVNLSYFPFADFDLFLPNPSLYTKFTFSAGDVLHLSARHVGEGIGGAIAGLQFLDFDGTFLQVNAPAEATMRGIPYRFAVDLGAPEPQFFEGLIGVPEPDAVALIALGLTAVGVGSGLRTQRV